MADIYGQSDAALAQKAANTYAAGVPKTLDQINKDIAATTAEFESKIQSGLTQADKDNMTFRLNTLKQQAAQAVANTQSNYDFATQQNALSGQQTQQSMADIQKAQAALAGQALGLTRTTPQPGGYAPQVADYLNYSGRTSAADLAALGGEGAVPAGAQVMTPGLAAGPGTTLAFGPQAGLAGVSQMASTLFSNALQGSAARAKSDIEQQQLNLGTSIEQAARDTAAAREQAQRDALQAWILQQKGNAIATASSMSQDLLKLQASAANADTRTGKQKAQAEIDMYQKKAAIDLKKSLTLAIEAAKSSGANAADIAQLKSDNAIAIGSTTPLGTIGDTNVANVAKIFNGKRINLIVDPTTKLATKYLEYDNGNINIVTVDSKGNAKPVAYSPYSLVESLKERVGVIKSLPAAKQKQAFKSYFLTEYTADQRLLLAKIYGNPSTTDWGFYYNMISKYPEAPKVQTGTLPPVTNKTTTAPTKTSNMKASLQTALNQPSLISLINYGK